MEIEEKDTIVKSIGNIGKWQWYIILPLALREVFTSWQMLSPPFLGMAPENYFCQDNGTTKFPSLQAWQDFANPLSPDGSVDKCSLYDLDYTQDFQGFQNGSEITSDTRPCASWVFYDNETTTLITDFQLVCSRSWYLTTSQVVYMFGVGAGVIISGIVSDNFGRSRPIFVFMVVLCVASIATAFSPNMIFFIIFRCLIAAAASAVWTTGYVYSMEIIGGDWKTILGIGLMFPWATGYSVLPLIAYYVPNWQHLQLVLSMPLPFFAIIYWFLPECPRWLLTKGRTNEAKKILENAIRINGKIGSQELQLMDSNDTENEQETKEESTIFDLIKTPNMRKITLIQWFNWFTVVLVYYGLTLNADSLIPGNVYINFSVGGLIEFPCYFLCILVLHYFGRRIPLALMFLSTGLFLLMTLGIGDDQGQVLLTIITLGKAGIVCNSAIIYLQSAELFPTVVRSRGLSTCSIISRIGSMSAPIIGRELNPVIVIIIFATLSVAAGIFTFMLPETKGKKLPDTIADGEDLGKEDQSYFCWIN